MTVTRSTLSLHNVLAGKIATHWMVTMRREAHTHNSNSPHMPSNKSDGIAVRSFPRRSLNNFPHHSGKRATEKGDENYGETLIGAFAVNVAWGKIEKSCNQAYGGGLTF